MMRIAILGEGSSAAEWAGALRLIRLADGARPELLVLGSSASTMPPDLAAVFVDEPASVPLSLMTELARRGTHIFLRWPVARSIADCRSLVALCEEAGIEIGVSRPLRFHAAVQEAGRQGHVEVISFRQNADTRRAGSWRHHLDEAVDLALALARASPKRIDTGIARRQTRLPLLTTAGIRFHNGTYAQLEIHHDEEALPHLAGVIAGCDYCVRFDVPDRSSELLTREAVAFLEALRAKRPPPVSVLDALQSMRVVEKLIERLR